VSDLFPGFAEHRIKTPGAEIYARVGGSGPPVLLLHGYPQTHVCWHKMAPALAREFTLVVADLRGYGQSSCPRGDGGLKTYTKRAMAEDMVALMRTLGHERFAVGGHDRGGRVAYRLALDHPAAVTRHVAFDILPTIDVWDRMRWKGAIASYHWGFLAQPYPLPETLIAVDPAYYVAHTLEGWTGDKTLDCFHPDALAAYKASLEALPRIHAVCEDYRAGAKTDRDLDEADRESGLRIVCPTLVLWATNYIGRTTPDPLAIWRPWCTELEGAAIESGHFMAEENPEGTLVALLPFLRRDVVTT